MTKPSSIATMTQTILEASHPRLSGHVRVVANPQAKRLVYHITKSPGLAVRVEIGRAFICDVPKIRERVNRIKTHSIQILCGERLADSVRLEA